MHTYEVQANSHFMQLSYSLWNGKESITHDDKKVSEMRSYQLATPHSFVVEEDGQDVEYRVGLGGGFGYVVRRNGTVIAEHHRPFIRYLTAVGFLVIVIGLLQLLLFTGGLLVGEPFVAARQFVNYWSAPVIFLGALPLAWWLKAHLRSLAGD